jgi:hypothetical protein
MSMKSGLRRPAALVRHGTPFGSPAPVNWFILLIEADASKW